VHGGLPQRSRSAQCHEQRDADPNPCATAQPTDSGQDELRPADRTGRTLFILDLTNPYRYVEIRGTAVVKTDDDMEFARQRGAKYDADLREHDIPGDRRVIVSIVPTRVRAVDMSG
jgi:hypothetical protein